MPHKRFNSKSVSKYKGGCCSPRIMARVQYTCQILQQSPDLNLGRLAVDQILDGKLRRLSLQSHMCAKVGLARRISMFKEEKNILGHLGVSVR